MEAKKTPALSFDARLFFWLASGFIIATVIGTLFHECGHYLVAKALGYHARINYGYTFWADSENNLEAEGTYDRMLKLYPRKSFLITLGGPVLTMLTGSVGLFALFSIRRRLSFFEKLPVYAWGLIYISLFWSRQVVNVIIAWIKIIMDPGSEVAGDEFRLARGLGLHEWTLPAAMAIVGMAVCAIVLFRFVPVKQRPTFILSGIAGGLAGYLLWLVILGPLLMP